MTVGEYCNRETIIIGPHEPVIEAVSLMREQHVGALVVTEERHQEQVPIGILTDRDILIEILAEGVSIDAVTVGDIMNRDPKVAWDDEDVTTIIKRMRVNGIRRMPVVNEENVLQGLITLDDLLELIAAELTDLAALISREQKQEQEKRP